MDGYDISSNTFFLFLFLASAEITRFDLSVSVLHRAEEAVYADPSSHPPDKFSSTMVHYPVNALLKSVHKYFIEKYLPLCWSVILACAFLVVCTVCQGDCSLIK